MLIEKVSANKQIEIIAGLAREIWNEHFIPIIGKDQVDYMLEKFQSNNAIDKQIKNGVLYFLIKNNNEAIGYIGAFPEKERLFLSKLYITSAERGKGYGRKAIEFLENLASNNDVTIIALTVNKNNLSAIGMYEKLGFENCGSIIQDIGNGFVMDDYKMEKSI